MKRLILLLTFATALFAIETGELSFYLIKEGRPLANQEVVIFKKASQQTASITGYMSKQAEFKTDSDGFVYTVLPVGSFQIQVIAKESGKPQAFVKKNFIIKKGQESQIIVSLKEDNTVAFEDDEAPKAAASDTNASEAVQKERGTLLLSLTSSENKKAIAAARVFVKGQTIDAKTDDKGFVELTLPAGEQVISVIHSDFSSQTLKVTVVPKESVNKFVEMSPASMELEEFVVLAPHVEGSVASVIAEERNSDAVGNVLGSEQFSKSGDSSAAAALKRVSGITIVGGKYVYVRGLGDRYSTVMLNKMHLPSPEPTKRVVPLDIFPTSVIKSIAIQKSYTADIPGSFGGGTVLIRSMDIPEDEGFVAASMSLYSNNSTGKEAVTNSDNSVPLPASVISASDNFRYIGGEPYTTAVRNNRSLNHQYTTLSPGTKFELSTGKSFDVTDNLKLGASATAFYKNTAESDDYLYNKYIYNINTQAVQFDSEVDAEVTTLNTQMGGMLNLGAQYYENNKIKYTFFTTNEYKDQTTLSHTDFSGATEDKDKTYYEYTEKSLTLHQLSGENEMRFSNSTDGYFDNLKIDWGVEQAEATRYEPGTVEYTYLYQDAGRNWDQKTWYYYFDLKDTVENYRADFTLPFEFNNNDNYTQMGVFIYNKRRDFDGRRFKLSDKDSSATGIDLTQDMDEIYDDPQGTGLYFESAYRPDDSYIATQDVTAFYIKQLLSVTQDIDLLVSLRQEASTQQLTNVKTGTPYAPLVTDDLFPGLGLTYRLNDEMQIRAAYSNTVSRPDFREFSPNRYLDPITENIVFGNPDLKATYITNYDLKYEWYFQSDEVISVALFDKEFVDPIETVVKVNAADGNTLEQTYRNAQSASSYGIEIDYRKRFGFLGSSFENLLFATNIALIKSKVKLDNDPNDPFVRDLTTKDRAMQGQSPYVVNLQLGYDDKEKGDSALFLFNQIGERIVILGTDKNEDQYQQPFAKLDFVTGWKLNNYYLKDSDFSYSVKFKASNLLDSEQKVTQGDLTTLSTKPGREFSLSLKIAY